MNPTQTSLHGPLRVGIVGPGRVGNALARALRDAGVEVEGPLGRGERPAGCDAILLCVPDGEIAAAAEVVTAAAPLVGHTSGATPLSALAHAGVAAFGLHPLQTVAHPGVRFEGVGAAVAGSTPEALAFASGLAERLGMTPFEIDDERPRRLPRRRVDGIELPGHAPGCRGDDRRRRRARPRRGPRAAGAPGAPNGREHRRTRARGGAHGAGGPRRRGHGRDPARRRSRRRRRSCSTCSTSSFAARATLPRRGPRHEDGPHDRRAARAARPRAPCGTHDRSRADDGLLPRRPPLADAASARGQRRAGGLAVREPDPVRAGRGLRRISARRAARHRPGRGRGRGHPVLARRRGGLSRRLRHHRRRRRPHRHARGRRGPARRGALPGRDHRGHKALQHGRPGRGVLRAEGCPAGARDPQAGPRPRHAGPDRGLPHDPRRRRPRAELAERLPQPGGARARPGPQPRPARGRGGRGRRHPRRGRGGGRGTRRARPAPASSRTIFSCAPPRTSPPSSA